MESQITAQKRLRISATGGALCPSAHRLTISQVWTPPSLHGAPSTFNSPGLK